jgi:lysophospholipase L1-like esterase
MHMQPGGWRRKLKLVVFALAPVTLITGGVEAFLRVLEWDKPQLQAPMLVCESAGLHQPDDDLFWTLHPDQHVFFQDAWITTNRLGLRSPEVPAKELGEFRILCLGESTTFGAGVSDFETYAARLEHYLGAWDSGMKYRVINAGVSAYSSFQSLKYLELRGLGLEPDIVLFYHEYNDSLQTLARDGGPRDEASLAVTDMQLFHSQRNKLHRALLSRLAIYRAITYQTARQRIAKSDSTSHSDASKTWNAAATDLPVRVTSAEKRQILEELVATCERNRVRLVVMHPSYRDSERHECDLTQFCQSREVPLFEAHDSLHPADRKGRTLFLDSIHPNVHGHDRLARDLFSFLRAQGYVGR